MFKKFNLSAPLLSALTKMGYTEPTPIQSSAIPAVLSGQDVFACAQTGTGKTAAFALPLLQRMSENQSAHRRGLRALILAPTRELALQIGQSFSDYGRGLSLQHVCIFGGVSQVQQVRKIKSGADIVVATPGRLLDLMQQGIIRLDTVEYLVLDEADRMLDMGFIHDLKKIIAQLPQQRQTLLFSATAPQEIMSMARTLLHKPVLLNVKPASAPPSKVDQTVYHVAKDQKRRLLQHVISTTGAEQTLIFTRTKRGADRVSRELVKNGVKSAAIHGDKSQNARERALADFRNKSLTVLVATDIASRGIDIAQLPHVINFELPEQAETYVHRIGRTGRAGFPGTAVSFCSGDEMPYLRDIQKLIQKNIPVIAHPYAG